MRTEFFPASSSTVCTSVMAIGPRSGATFSSQGDQPALSAGRADIKGSVFLDAGLTAQGVVDFTEATIGSNLDCRGGHLVGIGYQSALSANRAHINGSVLLGQGFTAQGEVELVSTTIGSLLECIGGHFVVLSAGSASPPSP